MSLPLVYADLLEACQQPGCPVCRLVQQDIRHYLQSLFYEKVNDGVLRQNLRKSLGFCHEHAWQIIEPGIGDALGVATIYHDILSNIIRRLPDKAPDPEAQGMLTGLFRQTPHSLAERIKDIVQVLTPTARCTACIQRDRSTEQILSELVGTLDKEEMYNALSASDGLCLPHLRQSMGHIQGEVNLHRLLSTSREKLVALDQELAEIIRKSDYRFHGESIGSERDAWRRVVATATNQQGL